MRVPKTYDDITRATVLEPDSSFRPSVDQERAALDGERILSSEEDGLFHRVSEALRSSGLDVSRVTAEIDGSRVTLRGYVSDVYLMTRLENVVRAIDDVGDIVDYLAVAPEA